MSDFNQAAKEAVEELLQKSSWENREVNYVQTEEACAYYEGAKDGIEWARQYLTKQGLEKISVSEIHENVTEKWSLHWYDPGINEEDTANYRRRILSVDANMRHSISRMFAEYIAPILAGASHIQAQREGDHEAYLKNLTTLADGYKEKTTELEQKVKELEAELAEAKAKVFDENFMRKIALGRNDIHREDILNLESENAALKAENAELKRKGNGNA